MPSTTRPCAHADVVLSIAPAIASDMEAVIVSSRLKSITPGEEMPSEDPNIPSPHVPASVTQFSGSAPAAPR